MSNPLLCERCGGELESDDAISIIEGVCCVCRRNAAANQIHAAVRPRAPRPPRPVASIPPARPRPVVPRGLQAGQVKVHSTVVSSPNAHDFGPSVRVRRRRRDLVIGATVGLLVTLGMTGYVLTNKKDSPGLPIAKSKGIGEYPVRLSVKPINAVVSVDGQVVGPADETGQLTLALPGSSEDVHWLEVAATGFHPVRRPLSIYSGVSEFAVELVPKPYDVAIRTTPDKAEIWINDELKGYSPLTLSLLPWERARLAVKRTGYQDVSRELAPPTQGDRVELDLPLAPAGVLVRVETDPPGALISIDGSTRGVTPATVELDSSYWGKPVKIAARKDGYDEAWFQTTLPTTPAAGPVSARLALAPSSGETPALAQAMPDATAATDTPSTPTMPNGQRIAFVLISPTGVGVNHSLLLEQAVDQIHRLQDPQQFAVLSCTAEGLERWPGPQETVSATSDQKIRAYDKVRAIRPSGRGALDAAFGAAMELRPDSIRLFASGPLSPKDLGAFATAVKDSPVSVHIVQSETGPDDDWLRSLVAANKGTLTVLGLAGTPAVARQGDGMD